MQATTRTIRNKIDEGMPSMGRKGIPFAKGFKWWMQNVVMDQGDTESLIDLKKEKFRIENELKRLQLLLQKGELIPRPQVLDAFLWRAQTFSSALRSFNRSLSPQLANKEVREVSDILKRAGNDVLERISKRSGILKDAKTGT